jgi:adenylate cyclase
MATEIRKLAAILAADVVGYSRLAGADEDRTLARLRALRSDLIDPTIAVHHGRVVKRTGDGALVEFRSVVEAVRCAIEVQNGMIERNAGLPQDRRIELRIGIHIGDVVEEADGDLMGDGVNVAARLEGVANPGAICLSEDAYRQVRARLDLSVSDLGEVSLKNIAVPLRAYALEVGKPAAAKSPTPAAAPIRLSLPDKPSIAVLPFQNMSGDPEQDYFADGMVEEITTGLSRIKWLFVIARNSSFVYKGRVVDVRQIGRELGVRYVLEGGVRKAGGRLRITAQLIEAETGAHLWADRYDGAVEDVFDLQDQITERVVGIVEPSLQRSEIERSRRKRPENLNAYDLYLRALPHMIQLTPEQVRIGGGFLEQALQLDPNYAAAHAMMAWRCEICYGQGGFDEAEKLDALRHARAALAGGTDDAATFAIAAVIVSHLDKDYGAAVSAIARALALNPSSTTALYFGAHIHAFQGDFALAVEYATRALRLSPFDPWAYEGHVVFAMADLKRRRYEEAASHFANAVQANPSFTSPRFLLAMTLALGGRLEAAREVLRKALELQPSFRSRFLFEIGLLPEFADEFTKGARLLDLPE